MRSLVYGDMTVGMDWPRRGCPVWRNTTVESVLAARALAMSSTVSTLVSGIGINFKENSRVTYENSNDGILHNGICQHPHEHY